MLSSDVLSMIQQRTFCGRRSLKPHAHTQAKPSHALVNQAHLCIPPPSSDTPTTVDRHLHPVIKQLASSAKNKQALAMSLPSLSLPIGMEALNFSSWLADIESPASLEPANLDSLRWVAVRGQRLVKG